MGDPLLARSYGHGLVERTGILVEQADIGARHRGGICLRVRGGRTAIPGANRGTRVAAGAALPGPAIVDSNTEHLPRPLFRSILRDGGVVGCGTRGGDGRGIGRRGAALGGGGVVVAAMDSVPIDSKCRTDVVLVRLGVAVTGNGFPGNLSRQRPDRAAGAGDLARKAAA